MNELPEFHYEKLMFWTFAGLFALIGVLSAYNHYFPEEPKDITTGSQHSTEGKTNGVT